MKALQTIQKDFYQGLKALFEELNIPVNYWAEEPADPIDILTENSPKGIPSGHHSSLKTQPTIKFPYLGLLIVLTQTFRD